MSFDELKNIFTSKKNQIEYRVPTHFDFDVRRQMAQGNGSCFVKLQYWNSELQLEFQNRYIQSPHIFINYYINIYILLKIIIEDIDIYEYDRYFFLWVAIGYEQGS